MKRVQYEISDERIQQVGINRDGTQTVFDNMVTGIFLKDENNVLKVFTSTTQADGICVGIASDISKEELEEVLRAEEQELVSLHASYTTRKADPKAKPSYGLYIKGKSA